MVLLEIVDREGNGLWGRDHGVIVQGRVVRGELKRGDGSWIFGRVGMNVVWMGCARIVCLLAFVDSARQRRAKGREDIERGQASEK